MFRGKLHKGIIHDIVKPIFKRNQVCIFRFGILTDQNIKAFSATAKKYGIDFALKKDTTGEIPRYLVFFKGRDADAVTAAFREFSAKNLAKEKKPSIRRRLTKAKEQAKRQELERGEKVKNRDRGLER